MTSPTGLLISRDVFFASKVTGTAQALGFTVRCVGLDALASAMQTSAVGLVLLDLECPGVTPADVAAAVPENSPVKLLAFGPHVHEERLAAATAAGFEEVLPRSKFSANLPNLLIKYLNESSQ